ncbi:MAG: tRNA threonylcarbamoyladenosine biosynthesis protein TsaB [Saprospiraceae bacterium]|jgi:tRNA threonylcarbamoyladenosine biosynthesis protein TsaB
MALILCIETATEVCSVALSNNGEVMHVETLEEGQKHSSLLVPLIDQCLLMASVQRSSLDAVAISNGPGSYTGLRVGASSVKAICYALDIPMIAIPTLESLAYPYKEQDRVVVSTIDARRMEAYMGTYHRGEEVSGSSNIIWTEDSIQALIVTHGPIIICGNGIEKAESTIKIPADVVIAPNKCDATLLCQLADHYFERGLVVDSAYHTPFYYKSPNITAPKAKFGLKG